MGPDGETSPLWVAVLHAGIATAEQRINRPARKKWRCIITQNGSMARRGHDISKFIIAVQEIGGGENSPVTAPRSIEEASWGWNFAGNLDVVPP
jgi:hypothetical protein